MRNSNRMQQHALIRVAIGRKVEVIVPHVLNRTAFLQVLFPTTTILAAKSFTMADTGVCSSTRSCGCSTVRGSIFVCTLSSTFILLNAIGAPHLYCNDSACTLSFFDFLFSNKHLLTFYCEIVGLPSYCAAICGRSVMTNFQKTLVVSFSSFHLGINFRASRKLSTNATPNNSSRTRTCHFFVTQILVSPINSV